MIRIGLIQFPGSNCERETALAVKRAGMEPIEFMWNESLYKLRSLDGYILVGGFSYEDRARAGIIAALDPVIQEIKAQSEQGKPVLGICNGAQILVEAGMVPGLDNQTHLALTENKRLFDGKILGTGFYNTWVNMRLHDNPSPTAFNRHLSPKQIITLPIAHAEGRFVMTDAVFNTLIEKGLSLFQYCDSQGQIIDNLPINPNGSMGNLAAVSNHAGNVLAMMPHPERTKNGDPIFRSMHDYIRSLSKLAEDSEVRGDVERRTGVYISVHEDSSTASTKQFASSVEFGKRSIVDNEKRQLPTPRFSKPKLFSKPANSHECLVKLIITDNHALTVEKTLRKLGFPVTVNRFRHWEINCDSTAIVTETKKSGVLYCERKEKEIVLPEHEEQTLSYLVRAKEDLIGQQALQTLKEHYAIQPINAINHGILWQFQSDNDNIHELIDNIFSTNIMGNQYANECYQYR